MTCCWSSASACSARCCSRSSAGNPLFWLVQGFTDVLLVAYLALLLRMKQTASERRAKVHYLPAPPSAPALVLRRSSVSS